MAKRKVKAYGLSKVKLAYIKKYIQGSSVLDVGSGGGGYSRWICDHIAKVEVSALDLKRPRGKQPFSFIQADLDLALAINDEKYENILFFDILSSLKNPEKTLAEVARICKVHGVIMGSVEVGPIQKGERVSVWDMQSLEKALKNVGFHSVSIIKKTDNPIKKRSLLRLLLSPLAMLFKSKKIKKKLFFVAKRGVMVPKVSQKIKKEAPLLAQL